MNSLVSNTGILSSFPVVLLFGSFSVLLVTNVGCALYARRVNAKLRKAGISNEHSSLRAPFNFIFSGDSDSNKRVVSEIPTTQVFSIYFISFLVLTTLHTAWLAAFQIVELMIGSELDIARGPSFTDPNAERNTFLASLAVVCRIGDTTLAFSAWGAFLFSFLPFVPKQVLHGKWKRWFIALATLLAVMHVISMFYGALRAVSVAIQGALACLLTMLVHSWPHLSTRYQSAQNSKFYIMFIAICFLSLASIILAAVFVSNRHAWGTTMVRSPSRYLLEILPEVFYCCFIVCTSIFLCTLLELLSRSVLFHSSLRSKRASSLVLSPTPSSESVVDIGLHDPRSIKIPSLYSLFSNNDEVTPVIQRPLSAHPPKLDWNLPCVALCVSPKSGFPRLQVYRSRSLMEPFTPPRTEIPRFHTMIQGGKFPTAFSPARFSIEKKDRPGSFGLRSELGASQSPLNPMFSRPPQVTKMVELSSESNSSNAGDENNDEWTSCDDDSRQSYSSGRDSEQTQETDLTSISAERQDIQPPRISSLGINQENYKPRASIRSSFAGLLSQIFNSQDERTSKMNPFAEESSESGSSEEEDDLAYISDADLTPHMLAQNNLESDKVQFEQPMSMFAHLLNNPVESPDTLDRPINLNTNIGSGPNPLQKGLFAELTSSPPPAFKAPSQAFNQAEPLEVDYRHSRTSETDFSSPGPENRRGSIFNEKNRPVAFTLPPPSPKPRSNMFPARTFERRDSIVHPQSSETGASLFAQLSSQNAAQSESEYVSLKSSQPKPPAQPQAASLFAQLLTQPLKSDEDLAVEKASLLQTAPKNDSKRASDQKLSIFAQLLSNPLKSNVIEGSPIEVPIRCQDDRSVSSSNVPLASLARPQTSYQIPGKKTVTFSSSVVSNATKASAAGLRPQTHAGYVPESPVPPLDRLPLPRALPPSIYLSQN
jgi:hypothetical protein